MKELLERLSEPTPKFWQKIRKYAVALGILGTAIVSAPVALPATVITIGGYMIAIGSVGAVLSQATSTTR